MTPQQFINWLAEMKTVGLAKSNRKCAELLGVTPHGIMHMEKNGTDRRTALACRALLHRLEPYGL